MTPLYIVTFGRSIIISSEPDNTTAAYLTVYDPAYYNYYDA